MILPFSAWNEEKDTPTPELFHYYKRSCHACTRYINVDDCGLQFHRLHGHDCENSFLPNARAHFHEQHCHGSVHACASVCVHANDDGCVRARGSHLRANVHDRAYVNGDDYENNSCGLLACWIILVI